VIGVLEVWHGFAWACPFSVCWAICWVLLPVGRRPAGPLHPCGALFLFLAFVGARCQGCSGTIPMHDAPEPRGLISRSMGSAKVILLDSLALCYCICHCQRGQVRLLDERCWRESTTTSSSPPPPPRAYGDNSKNNAALVQVAVQLYSSAV
jgi:hypothetical protein